MLNEPANVLQRDDLFRSEPVLNNADAIDAHQLTHDSRYGLLCVLLPD